METDSEIEALVRELAHEAQKELAHEAQKEQDLVMLSVNAKDAVPEVMKAAIDDEQAFFWFLMRCFLESHLDPKLVPFLWELALKAYWRLT